MKLTDIINEEKYTIIDPKGNPAGTGTKDQANQRQKKLGGSKKGYFVVPAKKALKARRTLEKYKFDFKSTKLQDLMSDLYFESMNEAVSKTYKIPTQKGTLHIEVEEDTAGVMVDVIFNRVDLSTTDIQFPTGDVEITKRKKKVKLKESVNEAYDFKPNKNMNNLMKGRKIKNVVYSDKLGFAIILDNGKFVLIRGHRATPGSEKELELESVNESQVVNKKTGKDITRHVLDLMSGKIDKKTFEKLTGLKNESVNEGASTEEKRIVMMAIKKIAKYRNVPLHYAVGDVIRAAQELERTIGK